MGLINKGRFGGNWVLFFGEFLSRCLVICAFAAFWAVFGLAAGICFGKSWDRGVVFGCSWWLWIGSSSVEAPCFFQGITRFCLGHLFVFGLFKELWEMSLFIFVEGSGCGKSMITSH